MDRTILHCDCNAYFASVESIARPELKNVPMAVCGDPKSRHGIILAKNELAKKYGIITAETVWQAKRKCKDLVLVAPHHEKYKEYSRRISRIYEQYTDQVEAFSVDESWLDVSGSLHMFGTGVEIADLLRKRVREEIGLTISVGVSFNKVFAKLGSDYKKPDATTLITRENAPQLLYPLSVGDMLYVGKKTAEILKNARIRTIGELAKSEKQRIVSLLGKTGGLIWEYANGLDENSVKRKNEQDPVKSVGNGITFRRNLLGLQDIKTGVYMLCDSVAARLRASALLCLTVQVQIKDPDFHVISRQKTLNRATNLTHEIKDAALSIVLEAWNLEHPIRMLSISGTNLTKEDTKQQLSMFEEPQEKNEKLDRAIDSIRGRYGKDAVKIASLAKTDMLVQEQEEIDP